jgi:hypothetical protein
MESNDLKSMSSDELWGLYGDVAAKLAEKIAAERAMLKERLRKIESAGLVTGGARRRLDNSGKSYEECALRGVRQTRNISLPYSSNRVQRIRGTTSNPFDAGRYLSRA